MLIRIIPLLIFSFSTITFADSATQTDWSGGAGVVGPVITLGNEFYLDTDVFYYNPCELVLQTGLEHIVDGQFECTWSVHSADVDGDGDMDVLGGAEDDGFITWWENDDGSGISWTEHTVDSDFWGAISVHSADVDGDGDMDILGAASAADEITWWENDDGSGISWTEHTIDSDFDGACSVYSADVDGDGDMDVLGAAYHDDDITWWENDDGSGISWTEHTIDSDFDGACSVYSADVDGDGDMDVLGAAYHDDDITWWENDDGSGISWTEHTIDSDFDGACSVYSADVDGDGDMDVLGAALYVSDITWWENVGGLGTGWMEHTVDCDFYGTGTWSVYSADVNGDGYMDILGDGKFYSLISWWDLTKYLSTGSLESSILDTGSSPDWLAIDWTSMEPSFTKIGFQVRSASLPQIREMSPWSDTLYTPCSLDGILQDGDRYMQYRTLFNTANPDTTPILLDVEISWDLLGIYGGEETNFLQLLPVSPNPSDGSPVVSFTLPENESVELVVFDLSGRIVQEIQEDEFSAGYYDVQLDELLPGIYFCRMIAGDFTATQRFVVIQ
ncbi:MAG: T9SS type A sorting domain-containing protein [Candidatus Aegiribacteria sp.]|nr:T9SS type A sorting domain-containing protein [Candidatus Aegiribacteria sp.]